MSPIGGTYFKQNVALRNQIGVCAMHCNTMTSVSLSYPYAHIQVTWPRHTQQINFLDINTIIRVLHRLSVGVRWSALECVGVCCSVLQCVAVCCSVLQCVGAQKIANVWREEK